MRDRRTIVASFDLDFITRNRMKRYALAPLGARQDQVLVAIPRRATDWAIADGSSGLHRLLVPVDASLRALDALHYIAADLASHVVGVHIVNVQSPVMTGDVTPLVSVNTIKGMRKAAGQRLLAIAGEALSGSAIPVTSEVAFGAPAEIICRLAQERRCTGIVIGRNGLELRDLISGSVAAKVLRLATVPVTIVNARTVAARWPSHRALRPDLCEPSERPGLEALQPRSQ